MSKPLSSHENFDITNASLRSRASVMQSHTPKLRSTNRRSMPLVCCYSENSRPGPWKSVNRTMPLETEISLGASANGLKHENRKLLLPPDV